MPEGAMETSAEEVETRIMSELDCASDEATSRGLDVNRDRPQWTALVKARLATLGRSLGFKVNSHGDRVRGGDSDPHWGEWLWDLAWIDYDDARQVTVDIPLVVESEWNHHELGADFEKLKVARARYRLMVFQDEQPEQVSGHIDYCRGLVEAFRQSAQGDRYLFAGLVRGTGRFRFELYVVGATDLPKGSDGPSAAPKLESQ